MGICPSSDIFQSKLYDLLGDIERIKTYIDNILVLGKGKFYQHIYQIIFIFVRICAAGLKVNAPKCSFVLNHITYLYAILLHGKGLKLIRIK